jgi:hypothetical protein
MDNDTFEVKAPELPEEVPDFYVEQSSAIRELELKMWHKIGWVLSEIKGLESDAIKDLEPYAKEMKKHISELQAAVAFFKKYPDFNSIPLDKASSWSKIKKNLGTQEEIKEKLTIKKVKEMITRRQMANEITGNNERASEDNDILTFISVNKLGGE